MSSIDGALASPLQPDQTKLRNTGKTADTYLKFDPDAPADQVDTVEISVDNHGEVIIDGMLAAGGIRIVMPGGAPGGERV